MHKVRAYPGVKGVPIGCSNTRVDDDEPDWIIEHARQQRKQNAMAERKEFEDRLARVRAVEERQRKKLESANRASKKSVTSPTYTSFSLHKPWLTPS